MPYDFYRTGCQTRHRSSHAAQQKLRDAAGIVGSDDHKICVALRRFVYDDGLRIARQHRSSGLEAGMSEILGILLNCLLGGLLDGVLNIRIAPAIERLYDTNHARRCAGGPKPRRCLPSRNRARVGRIHCDQNLHWPCLLISKSRGGHGAGH